MRPSDRLTVPTCIGCGAMSIFGKCETGCSEHAYRSAQCRARDLLRNHPKTDQDGIDPEQEAEHATTWWCAECGGLDAPQPCLGICLWRPVDWVKRSLYEELRKRTVSEHEREQRLRHLLRRVAWITPRPGQWELSWRLLQNEAREVLDARRCRPERKGRAGVPSAAI